MKTVSKFILFEGGEGSGKSTQVRMLAEKLRSEGHEVVATKEPGGTRLGSKIREILLNPEHTEIVTKTEWLLFYADRAQHIAEVILPALEAGKVVVCDRFFFSTWAYQHKGRQHDFAPIKAIHDAVVSILPDLVILLDIDPVAGLARKHKQEELTRMEHEKLEFHQRVNQGFRDFAAEDPDRWHIVDASQPIEEIHNSISTRVLELLS